MFKTKEDEQGDEKQTQAELVLKAATNNIQKLFVDEYQEPHVQ